MKKYFPKDIEPKWQKKWEADQLYFTDLSEVEKKYYVLAELPYSSGDLHIGHWFTFTFADVLTRFKKMEGYNSFLPIGFDAFGLPAENAAIRHGIHPRDWTLNNVIRMKGQFNTMGASVDWSKSMTACLPDYYKWNQWIFLKMLEKGLAYKGKLLSNWCPSCQTVLANENVEGGHCWRCGTEVVQKEVEQWFLKITAYADRLIWPENPKADWPKSLRDAQNNWIGRSEGILIKFDSLEVFTTRPDTIFGATFLVVSPEHPHLDKLTTPKQAEPVKAYVEMAKRKSELERKENKEKTGVFTGSFVKNPANGEDIPVWVADYVLMGYGTSAIMAVPAHDQRDFEFAKEFNLPIKEVISFDGKEHQLTEAYIGEGKLINSDDFNDLDWKEAKEKISNYLEKANNGSKTVQYHLRDWSISRQRYWGTPIPVIYCDNCGMVPVPEKDLPVELPYNVDYAPKGKPPLATDEEWMNVICPNCGGSAKREAETMDTFIDSSWYFFRYLDSTNDQEIFGKEIAAKWMPLEIYIGGAEHTLGHALYSRFVTMFFHDIGLINFDEYAKKRIHHGLILGTDGQKMSKSKGNVVNPDEEVKKYGADAIRTYLSFLGPINIVAAWDPNGVNGVYRFIERVWNLFEKVEHKAEEKDLFPKDLFQMHKTIKKVSEDLEVLKNNTAIAALMEWLNYLSRKGKVNRKEYKTLVLLLAPFAPHISEELWSLLGESYSVHQQSWPKFAKENLEMDEVTIVVQVNGKVRDNLVIHKDIESDIKIVESRAKELPKVAKFLAGKEIKKVVYIPVKIINFVI